MKLGDSLSITHLVSVDETAKFLGSGTLEVYATPAMICHMEQASCKFAEQFGHHTVGTKVDISHVRACKVGTEVMITAELTGIDGRKLEFHVTAKDCNGVIGEGRHQRFIIDPERFMSKLG